MTNRRQFVTALGGAAALGALQHPLAALAEIVAQQVKIYYGFPAGSAGDSVARRVADKLGGTDFTRLNPVVENKPGAGGRIALDSLKSAPADGSVLALSQASALSTYPYIYSKLSYGLADFAPVSIGAVMTHGLAVGPMVPASVKTLKDYVAWAKANPGQASYGSPGAGSTPHFLGALLGLNSGADLRHVPYRGSLPAVNDVVGGQIADSVNVLSEPLPFAKEGRIRVLATTGSARSPYLPEAPTMREAGFRDFDIQEYFAVWAPAKTPPAVANALAAQIRDAVATKELQEAYAARAFLPSAVTPRELDAMVRADLAKWAPIVQSTGFSIDS